MTRDGYKAQHRDWKSEQPRSFRDEFISTEQMTCVIEMIASAAEKAGCIWILERPAFFVASSGCPSKTKERSAPGHNYGRQQLNSAGNSSGSCRRRRNTNRSVSAVPNRPRAHRLPLSFLPVHRPAPLISCRAGMSVFARGIPQVVYVCCPTSTR